MVQVITIEACCGDRGCEFRKLVHDPSDFWVRSIPPAWALDDPGKELVPNGFECALVASSEARAIIGYRQ